MDQREVTIVLEIMRQQLLTQIAKGYGTAIFTINIQDGKVVYMKCNQETAVKIGS